MFQFPEILEHAAPKLVSQFLNKCWKNSTYFDLFLTYKNLQEDVEIYYYALFKIPSQIGLCSTEAIVIAGEIMVKTEKNSRQVILRVVGMQQLLSNSFLSLEAEMHFRRRRAKEPYAQQCNAIVGKLTKDWSFHPQYTMPKGKNLLKIRFFNWNRANNLFLSLFSKNGTFDAVMIIHDIDTSSNFNKVSFCP